MPRLRSLLPVLLVFVLQAAPVRAIDTFEPYPVGLHAAEAYMIRVGSGSGDPAARGFAAVSGLAVGLAGRSHVYGFMGLSSDDRQEGGLDFVNLGLFQNILNGRAVDLDFWLELTAAGEGLASASRGAGLELNYDGPRGGLFWRGAQHWEPGGEEDSVGKRRLYSYGIYFQAGPKAQVLAELQQESLSGFATGDEDRRTTSWALGLNRKLSPITEMILEARAQEPPKGSSLDRTWDFTVGWVVVW
jgi:hypothetical protein